MPDSPASGGTGAHYFSSRTPALEARELSAARAVEIEFNAHTLRFVTAAGVFSRREFDLGSQLLLDRFLASTRPVRDVKASSPKSQAAVDQGALTPEFDAKVLDLGCGWGPIAAFLSAHRPSTLVYATDVNARAVQLCRHNLALNGLRGHVWCGDGPAAARSAVFTHVLLNPPVRAGNAVIERLCLQALRAATSEGELWLVLRTAQGARSWARRLEEMWGECATLEIERGYRVLRCRRAPDAGAKADGGAA